MKRMLALLMSFVMLLGACAFAEEAGANHSYALSDIVFTYGETTVDLSNITLCLDIRNDAPAALIHLDADGETAAEIGVTMVDDLSVLHVAGTQMGHKDFVLNPALQMEKRIQEGVEGLVGLLQSIDARAAAEKIGDLFEDPMSVPAEAATAENDLSKFSIEGDIASALQDCMTSMEDSEVDDVADIPAGKYDVDSISIDEKALAGMLDMLYVDGEPIGLGDTLRESGAAAQLSATRYESEGFDAVVFEVGMDYGGEDYGARIVVMNTADEGSSVATCDISLGDSEGTPIGLKFTLSGSASVDSSFTPDSVDLANAVNLDEMTEEEALDALSDTLEMLEADALIPIAGPLMELMMANVDMDALQAEIDAATADDPAA